MEIEQVKPNKPNFLLIVGIFCASLIVIFILVLIFLNANRRHLGFRHHTANPNATLTLPGIPPTVA
jgi:hypothetical protein